MTPTIGRIVHYTNRSHPGKSVPPEVQAAIITKINDDDTVALHIFYPTGAFDRPNIKKTSAVAGTEEARGMWNWPAR